MAKRNVRRGLALAAAALLAGFAGTAMAADSGAMATFRGTSFVAHDPLDRTHPLGPGEFRNPILPGFHPDPSVVRVGDDYYLVNSSFAIYPGLPVFHSRDLVHWTQIGNAIDRPGMFDFTGLGVARAVFAPTIRHHDGLFYLINTCVECGGNFILTARDPAGPWSDPVFLPPVDGIDPDLFFDDDGKVWITNNGAPVGEPRYPGHRALWLQQYDPVAHQMVGPRRVIVDAGVHPEQKPVWTEGPHIYKVGGYYYLMAAEGGTAGDHSETIYRASAVTGPYLPGPVNPILTQRDLDPARPDPVYATGHADLVQTARGDWWAVFLGTRPYRDNLANLGRETFLLPVTWRDGWPQILPARTPVPQALPAPKIDAAPGQQRRAVPDWIMLRTPKAAWHRLAADGTVTIDARAQSLSGKGNPSFLAKRQAGREQTVTTEIGYAPTRVGDHAGLAAFADENHFFTFGLWQTAQGRALVVTRRNGAGDPAEGAVIASVPLAPRQTRVRLRLRIADPAYTFTYALDDGRWRTALADVDGAILASEPTNQFTGALVGLYAARD